MTVDANIQVWLQAVTRSNPDIIVPYVQSNESKVLRYRMHTVKTGVQGRSELRQAGTVTAQANVATPLVRMSVSRSAQDDCYVEIVLSDGQSPEKSYSFECPLPP